MPPKTKFTKEEIVDAAYEILRTEGEEALTAREVGKRLGTSSSPIFTVFSSMGELKDTALKKATDKFIEYMNVADEYYPAYKKRGMQWIKFAKDEPVLFGILFMKRNVGDGERAFFSALESTPFDKEKDIEYIIHDYNATPDQAEHMFRQMWIFSYGMCVLVATGVCDFSENEIVKSLGEMFKGTVYVIKTENDENVEISPVGIDGKESKEMKKRSPNFKKN